MRAEPGAVSHLLPHTLQLGAVADEEAGPTETPEGAVAARTIGLACVESKCGAVSNSLG